MTVKNWTVWTTLPLILILTTSCASLGLGTKKVEVSSKPIQIDIIQPYAKKHRFERKPVKKNAQLQDLEPNKKMVHGYLGKENLITRGYTYLDKF